MRLDRLGLVALGLCLALGCNGEKAETVETGKTEGDGAKKGDGPGGVAAKAEGEYAKYRKDANLRLSLTDHSHLAVRSNSGLINVDLGTIGARKHTNGGWRTGWDTTPRKDGDVTYFEADSKTARVFFKHKKGGFDKIIIRMKAVKSANKVVFYVNDNPISNTEITGKWEDYTVEIPAKATKNGENQLMMRFTYDTVSEGRKQSAHVDGVWVMPAGAKKASSPTGPSTQKLVYGGVSMDALVAATPQTYTYRLQVPENGTPKLGFGYAAKAAGAKLTVTAAADGVEAKTLFEETPAPGSWTEKVVDLSAFAGKVTEFQFTAGGDWAAGQLVGWGEPGLYTENWDDGATAAKEPTKHAKHVLIYLIDTMRYDKLGVYNKKSSVKTPNIDAFAAEGTVYDWAYDNENWTKPSCATILTGLYPGTHKTKEDASKLPQKAITLGEHFQKNGFKTSSFIANGYVSDAFGFKQGWNYYTNYIREGKNTNVDNLVNDALSWIDKNKDERMFIYMQTIDPHVPYSPPKEWREKYWKRAYNGPIKPQATGNQLADIKTGKMSVTKEDKRYLEALYDGETAFNDHHFGRLVAALKERGLYEDTAILIITDHGEEFWDHGKVGHGHSLYDEMIHSPFILRYPNKVPQGRRVPHVISMVDVAPTLYDITGVESHDKIEGTTVLDALNGVGDARPRIAVSDFLFRKKSFRAGRYHWITNGRGGQLYDVVADRGEQKNVIGKHAIGRAYVRSMAGVFMGSKDKTRWWENSQREGAKIEVDADMADIDEDLQKQLEAMGYVDGAKGDEADDSKDEN